MKNQFVKPIVIGHRGYRAKYPENTLASFSAAMDAGADMIELDVHLTKDNQLAVIHDEKVDRTTNGEGRVRDLKLNELRSLDAGGWFDLLFSGERIPALGDVLDLARNQIHVNIEIKAAPESRDVLYRTGDRALELIKKKKAFDFVVISSFSMPLLKHIRSQSTQVAMGVLTYKKKQGFLKVCEAIGAMAWHPHYKYFTLKEMEQVKDLGLKILPYTVNEKQEMNRLLEMGVDGFFTDDPVLGRQVVNQVSGKSGNR